MKTIKIFTGIFFIMLFASAYAAASKWMPEKYDLDDQLTKVSRIPVAKFIGWEKIDNQSFVLQARPGSYYLIVLSYPAYNLPFTEGVAITSMSLMVRPGFDNVYVRAPSGHWEKYVISRIYKLEDKNQAWEIIAQLTGKQPIEREKMDSSGETLLASTPLY